MFSIRISPNNTVAFSQQQMYASEMEHQTRSCYTFFDGITSFSSMLHSFLTAFRKTIYQTIYQTITNKIKNPFLRQKESLRNHFRERKTV